MDSCVAFDGRESAGESHQGEKVAGIAKEWHQDAEVVIGKGLGVEAAWTAAGRRVGRLAVLFCCWLAGFCGGVVPGRREGWRYREGVGGLNLLGMLLEGGNALERLGDLMEGGKAGKILVSHFVGRASGGRVVSGRGRGAIGRCLSVGAAW